MVKRLTPAALIALTCCMAAGARGEAPGVGGSVTPERDTAPCEPMAWEQMLEMDRTMRPPVAQHHVRPAEPPPTDIAPAGAREGAKALSPASGPAPLLGGCVGIAATSVADISFRGFLDDNSSIPPDTMGAVGPNHVVTMINNRVVVQTRAGGAVSSVTLDAFWSGIGTGTFDPHIVFDGLSQRWIAVCSADRRTAASKSCLAVSATNSPAGVWNRWAIDADAANLGWADYPSLGTNQTWVAFTQNMFANSNDASQGPKMWVFDKSVLLAGGAAVFTEFPVGFSNTGTGLGSTLQPTLCMDATSSDLFVVDNNWQNGATKLARLSRITGTATSPAWSVLAGAPFGFGLWDLPSGGQFTFSQIDAAQMGDARRIDVGGSRARNAVYRNGRVYWAWGGGLPSGTGTSNRTAAFWGAFNVSGGFGFFEASNIDPGTGGFLIYPTIAVNCAGDLCLGFTRADAGRFAEAAYVVKPAGQSPGPVRVLKAGESAYYKTFGGTRNRWGDYSSTVVDPVDESSFWTIQEYAALRVGSADNDSRFGVWWGRIPACESPQVTQQPVAASACPWETAPFAVTAGGTTPLTYQWQIKTVAGPWAALSASPASIDCPGGGTGTAFASPANSASVSIGVQGCTSGLDVDWQVRCVVGNGCGSATSDEATLTIIGNCKCPTPEVVCDPQPLSACAGGTAVFGVSGTGSGLTYQWRKGVTPLSDGPTGTGSVVSGSTTAGLTITNLSGVDAGTYNAVLSNVCGSAPSLDASLVVSEACTCPPLVLDFNALAPGSIVGQDGWQLVLPVYSPNYVVAGAGPDGSNALGSGAVNAQGVGRALPFAFTYSGADTAVVWRAKVKVNGTFGLAAVNMIFDSTQGPAGSSVAFGIDRETPGGSVRSWLGTRSGVVLGDVLTLDHWYEVRVVVNFTSLDASATLEYRDITAGAVAFTVDSIIVNQSLALTLAQSPRTAYWVATRMDTDAAGATLIDDVRIDPPRLTFGQQPVARTVCPTGSGAFSVAVQSASGPLAYQWQVQTAPSTWQDLTPAPGALPCGGTATGSASPANAASVAIALKPCPGSPGAPQNFQVRCVVSGPCGRITSAAANYRTCPADFNCTGTVSVQDLFDFLASWFAQDGSADFNQNGPVTVQDLFDFLGAWFAKC